MVNPTKKKRKEKNEEQNRTEKDVPIYEQLPKKEMIKKKKAMERQRKTALPAIGWTETYLPFG
ncbi:MAG: hypothetical protein Q8P67_08010 [archaeon]|nr:hypothetical protein [archaeon]